MGYGDRLWGWMTGDDAGHPPERRHVTVTVNDVFDAMVEEQGRPRSGLPAVYRATSMTADLVASLPIRTVRVDTGVDSRDPLPVLDRPDPDITRHEFLTAAMLSALHTGDLFLYVTARDRYGHALAYRVLNPHDVSVRRGDDGRPVYTHAGVTLARDLDIVHVAWNRAPGELTGRGPIEAARRSLDALDRMEDYAARFYADSATPSGVLEVPGQLSGDEAADLKAQWVAQHRGKREPAVLSGGVTFEPINVTPEDAQFIETRQYAVADVARLFGMPGPLLGASLGDSLTYATTESILRWWITTTIQPTYLERLEQALTTQMPRTVEARFDTRQLLRADTQARYTAYETALRSGWLTAGEVRQWEGLDPSRTPADVDEEPNRVA